MSEPGRENGPDIWRAGCHRDQRRHYPNGPLVDFAESDWERIFNVNVKGIFLLTQAALPYLKRTGGVIINIASVAGKRGFAQMGAFCASKFAAIGLTQSMAAELAEFSIRVNAICPGNIDTAMWFDHLSKTEARIASFRHAYR